MFELKDPGTVRGGVSYGGRNFEAPAHIVSDGVKQREMDVCTQLHLKDLRFQLKT